MTRLITSAFAALVLAGMLAPSALAEKSRSVSVSYAGLNLASPDGAKTMLNRLQKASRKICNSATLRNPEEIEWAQACMKETVASAVNRLNAPMVTVMFLEAGRYEMASR
jgi:UrcA family protein